MRTPRHVYMAGNTLPGAVASTLTKSGHGPGIQKLYPKGSVDREVRLFVEGMSARVCIVVSVHLCLYGLCVCVNVFVVCVCNIHRSIILVCLFDQHIPASLTMSGLNVHLINIYRLKMYHE